MVVGASVADRVVLFSRDSREISETFTFEIPKSAGRQVKILLTDLSEGKWQIFRNGKPLMQAEVNPESGTIYFNGSAGKYVITR
jgi:hypothetical protein